MADTFLFVPSALNGGKTRAGIVARTGRHADWILLPSFPPILTPALETLIPGIYIWIREKPSSRFDRHSRPWRSNATIHWRCTRLPIEISLFPLGSKIFFFLSLSLSFNFFVSFALSPESSLVVKIINCIDSRIVETLWERREGIICFSLYDKDI